MDSVEQVLERLCAAIVGEHVAVEESEYAKGYNAALRTAIKSVRREKTRCRRAISKGDWPMPIYSGDEDASDEITSGLIDDLEPEDDDLDDDLDENDDLEDDED